MKKIVLIFCLFVGLAGAATAAMSPDQLVRETTDKVLSELAENRNAMEQNPERLYRMVNEIVLPHFDFERMSRSVLGKHWRSANPAQQRQFTEEFKTLLVRTYATALFEYTDQKIVYKPFRHEEGDSKAIVRTEVQPGDGPPIPIEYALMQDGEEWKVYDIKIDALSLVTNYRSQYDRTIRTEGIDTLIASLSEKNEQRVKDQ